MNSKTSLLRTALMTAAITLITPVPQAWSALYKPGDTVANFSLTVRRPFTLPNGQVLPAGNSVQLEQLAGRIVFLEWFAVWCPFCTAAAPQVVAGIDNYYKSRGGNPDGIEVLHVAVDQESNPSFRSRTETFIDRYSFVHVVNDYNATSVNKVRFQFQNTGQPIFAVINGVTNSPSHRPWQLLVNHLGYGDSDFSTELASFRAKIDAVKAAPPAPLMLSVPLLMTGGPVQFAVNVPPGRKARVEISEDLSQWGLLREITGGNEPVTVEDGNTSSTQRYYRVLLN